MGTADGDSLEEIKLWYAFASRIIRLILPPSLRKLSTDFSIYARFGLNRVVPFLDSLFLLNFFFMVSSPDLKNPFLRLNLCPVAIQDDYIRKGFSVVKTCTLLTPAQNQIIGAMASRSLLEVLI